MHAEAAPTLERPDLAQLSPSPNACTPEPFHPTLLGGEDNNITPGEKDTNNGQEMQNRPRATTPAAETNWVVN